jgi:WD40 repeat protein
LDRVLRAGTRGQSQHRYDAFISYSQQADLQLAQVLSRDMRRFAHKPLRVRALRIYRDHENLAAHPDLWAKVSDALEQSRYFVLMATPAAAGSRWVRREVGYWQRNRDPSTFLIVHTGGEIVWDETTEDFDWDKTTALPQQLRGWFPAQPGWVPLGWAATQESDLSLHHPRYRTAVCKIAAPVHGIEQDELDSVDGRRQRQLSLIKRAVVIALVLLSIGLFQQLIRANQATEQARQNLAVANERFANLVAAESRNSTVSLRDPGRALLLARNAVDMWPNDTTRAALYDALESQPRLTRILMGHSANKVIKQTPADNSSIRDLLYNPATGELISAGDDGRIIRWDPATSRRQTLSTSQYVHRAGVWDLAVNRDGTRLASTGGGTAVWDLTTGRPVFGLYQRIGGTGVGFDAEGRLQLRTCTSCATTGEEFQLWDPATRRQLSSYRYPLHTIAVATNGTTTAGGGCLTGKIDTDSCTQGFVQLWDSASGQPQGEPLVVAGKEITSIDLSPDNTRIVTGTRDGRIQLWDIPGRRMLADRSGHTGMVRVIRFSPDGKRFGSGGQDGLARVWDTDNVGTRPQDFAAYGAPVTALAFSPFGHQLATGNALNIIMVWSLNVATHTGAMFPAGPETEPRSVVVSPDGTKLVLGGGDGIITVYDKASRTVIKQFPVAPVCPHQLDDYRRQYHPCYINVMRFSPDGGMLLVAASSGNIGRWDTRTWAPAGDPFQADVPCGSLICDGRTLTTKAVAFSPDLHLVAVGGKRQIWLWDLKTRDLVRAITAHDDDVTSLAFSSDGRLLASGSKDRTVRLWDVGNGQQIGKPMRHNGQVTSVRFQPHHHRLASNGADNAVRIWDTDTQEQVTWLRNDSSNYEPGLVFSDDGAYLATTTANYYIALWDARTWGNIPRPHDPAPIMALAFVPSSLELVSTAKGSGEKAPTHINLHNFDVDEWSRQACAIVPRNLRLTLIQTYTRGETQACSEVPVDGSIIRNWLDTAQSRLDRGDANDASDAYREATHLVTADNNDDTELAHLVCIQGTVNQHAGEVLPACDHAVARSWASGPFRTSRAAARAQLGDRVGAIDDLRAFLDWADASGLYRPGISPDYGLMSAGTVAQREDWIRKLANGQDPFTPDVLSSLWQLYLQDQGGNTYETCPVNVGGHTEWVERPIGC